MKILKKSLKKSEKILKTRQKQGFREDFSKRKTGPQVKQPLIKEDWELEGRRTLYGMHY